MPAVKHTVGLLQGLGQHVRRLLAAGRLAVAQAGAQQRVELRILLHPRPLLLPLLLLLWGLRLLARVGAAAAQQRGGKPHKQRQPLRPPLLAALQQLPAGWVVGGRRRAQARAQASQRGGLNQTTTIGCTIQLYHPTHTD